MGGGKRGIDMVVYDNHQTYKCWFVWVICLGSGCTGEGVCGRRKGRQGGGN